jgi:hypothetical protein
VDVWLTRLARLCETGDEAALLATLGELPLEFRAACPA